MIVSSNNLSTLPKGWASTAIKDCIDKIPLTGKKIRQREYKQRGKLPVIDQGQEFIGGYTDKEKLRIHTDSPVVVFGDHTKVFKYVDFDFAAGADGIKVMKPYCCFFPKLFYYFLQAFSLPDKGYARHFQFLEKAVIPVPPLAEQHRIVAKVEELFTKLDAGVEALKKIKQQLKRYRQAVLKHAFEGKLTEKWRQAHKCELEPASNLLERIANERQKTAPACAGRKGKKQPPCLPNRQALDTSNLPELPEGWEWAIIKGIGEVVTGTTPSKKRPEYYREDFSFYKPTDLNAGYYVRHSEDNLSNKGLEKARLLPAKSTLVTCIGATIGKTGFIRVEGASNQQINAIIPEQEICPEYIYFGCISPQFQKTIFDNASATTLPILNKGKFELLAFPVPPFSEQQAIVAEVERHFSVADQIEQTIEQGLKQSGRLRQSILKKAFEGKLVPQDPEDEPAEKLLERIKAEKAKLQMSRNTKKCSRNSY